jgi:hypothetical protein
VDTGYIFTLERIIGRITGDWSAHRIYCHFREDHWEAYRLVMFTQDIFSLFGGSLGSLQVSTFSLGRIIRRLEGK